MLGLQYGSSIDALYKRLPDFVRKLRQSGRHELDLLTNWSHGSLELLAEDIGIDRIYFKPEEEGNFALFFLQGDGGAVPSDGNLILPWIESLIRSEEYKDVWEKLGSYELTTSTRFDEKHLYIFAGSKTEFSIGQVLQNIFNHMPSKEPFCPPEVTHLWVQGEVSSAPAILWTLRDGWVLASQPQL